MLTDPIPSKVRIGDPVRAADHNKLIDLVTALQRTVNTHSPRPSGTIGVRKSSGGTTHHQLATATPGAKTPCPLELVFTEDAGTLYASVYPTYVTLPVGKYGAHAAIVPKLGGTPIIDDGTPGWVPPKVALGNDTYKVWLTTRSNDAKVEILASAAADPERKDENTVDLLAKIIMSGGVVDSIERYNCPRLAVDLPHRHEGFPFVYNTGTQASPTWKVRFTPATVTDVEDGTVTAASNAATEHAVATADVFYLKHEVGSDGATTGLTFSKEASAPTTTPWVDGSTGTYYYKLATIDTDAEGGLYPIIHRSRGIDWQIPDSATKHPFEVTENGDATLTLEQGFLKWLKLPSAPNTGPSGQFEDYAGTATFTVTTTGYLYLEFLSIAVAHQITTAGGITCTSYNQEYSTGLTITNSADAPDVYDPGIDQQVFIPIAQVDLTAGVATVLEQIQRDDIEFSVQWAEIS